jgi:hypothetical protein
MTFPPDSVEKQISTCDQAWTLLNKQLPKFQQLFELWKTWHKGTVNNHPLNQVISNALVIAYARMALRNGSLSTHIRCYHSESHIDDLIYRLMAVSKHTSCQYIPDYGWSLLSLFMASHDLRQSEINTDNDLVGCNEQASYQEVIRIIDSVDTHKTMRNEHKQLLKLMIHGSTFGKGEDNVGNIYQGNLVKYLLNQVGYFEEIDKELAYLACDIDTANVSANLKDYSQSSINVFHEIQRFAQTKISAKLFFGDLQKQYFFNLQKFNSKIGLEVFSEQKSMNAPKIEKVCQHIESLNDNLSDKEIIKAYCTYIDAQA